LLVVGAEDPALQAALAQRGYDLTAVDTIEEASGPPADILLFHFSLHSMAPLDRALERARGLLRDGGTFVAEEVAFDRVNVHTARWLYDREAVLVAAGIVQPPAAECATERRPLARWRLEHVADPPLASGHDLLAAVRGRFEIASVEEAPYLYRYL